MKNNLRRSVLVALTLAAALAPLSCRTMKKATGTQEVFLQASPERVVAAVEAAMKELSLTVLTVESSGVDGLITARTAQDKSVTVKVNRQNDDLSRVTIKVGVIGDKPIGSAIIAKTKKRLE